MRQIVLLSVFFISTNSIAQIDNVGAGRALLLNGVHDYVNFGSVYHSVKQPFTISAWVYIDPASGPCPIFSTNDTDTNYHGFWFFVSPTILSCEFGDGTGGNNPYYRRGKQAYLQNVTNRWIHVCAVMTAPFDIQLYVNGVDVGGYSSGGSNLPMATSFPTDTVKSGYVESNGGYTYYFKGMLDEVRLWNRSLSQPEVQRDMCRKLKGTESGLIGYWPFDETSGRTIFDKSPNGFNGRMVNSPKRVYSGAPIGDDSNYLYTTSWTGKTVSMTDGSSAVKAYNIQGAPSGIQLYEVKSVPSQTGGLDLTKIGNKYFGVFLANNQSSDAFSVNFKEGTGDLCAVFQRDDNSVSTWGSSPTLEKQFLLRQEFLPYKITSGKSIDTLMCSKPGTLNSPFASGLPIKWSTGDSTQSISIPDPGLYKVSPKYCNQIIDSINVSFYPAPRLGNDTILCNQNSWKIVSHSPVAVFWNTGDTTKFTTVNQSGTYWAQSKYCSAVRDSVAIFFLQPPSSFSLGADAKFCDFKPVTLRPFADTTGLDFLWQDGSKRSILNAVDSGLYWVKVRNYCGFSTDTVRFSRDVLEISKLPNVITPNGDDKNEFFKIPVELVGELNLEIFNRWGKKVYESTRYMNDWNGSGLDAGVYFLLLTGACVDHVKETITILR